MLFGTAETDLARRERSTMSVDTWPRSSSFANGPMGTHKLDTIFELERDHLVKAARRTPYKQTANGQRKGGPLGTGWWAKGKELSRKAARNELIENLGLTTLHRNFLALTKHHAVPKGSPLLTHGDDADAAPYVDCYLQMLVTARCLAPDRYELTEVYFSHRCVDWGKYGDLLYCGSAQSPRVTSRAFCSGHDVRSWLICGPALRGPMTFSDEATVIEMGKESVPEICHQMSPRKVFALDDNQLRYVSQITDTKNPLYNMHLTPLGETATNWVAERTARHKLTGDDLAEHAKEVMQHMTREEWGRKSAKAGGSKNTKGMGMKAGPAKVKHAAKSAKGMLKFAHLPPKAKARAISAAQKRGHEAAKLKPCRCGRRQRPAALTISERFRPGTRRNSLPTHLVGSTTHNRMSHHECRFYKLELTAREKVKGQKRYRPYENQPRCYECP